MSTKFNEDCTAILNVVMPGGSWPRWSDPRLLIWFANR
jgi:hypothetical protein